VGDDVSNLEVGSDDDEDNEQDMSSVTVAWVVLVIAGVIIIGVISTYFLVKFIRQSSRGEYVRGDSVLCYRTPESEAEEGIVQLVMPQRSPLCGSAPEYSVVFREDGHRGRVPALQMIEKIGHEEADAEVLNDEGSLALLSSYEARLLVDEIIDESTSPKQPERYDAPISVTGEVEESGGSLVEDILRTVNDIVEQDQWPQNETAPQKLQAESGSEAYADNRGEAYDDRDEGYADGEEGYEDLVGETVRQVLNDRRSDEDEMMNVNATELVESVLLTLDDVDVEQEMDQPTNSIAAQNMVNDLMADVWTDEAVAGSSPSRKITTDRSKEFVSGILDEIALDDQSDSWSEGSDHSKEFISGILNDLGVGEGGQPVIVPSSSQHFVSNLLDTMPMDGDEDENELSM